MTLFGGSPFYKGQKIAPLYMQSLVPRAMAIIENGGQAKYFGGKFNFPCACVFGCDFFDFSRGKSSSTFSESSGFPSNSRRQLVHHHPSLFAKCQHCCPPTVPNSVQTIWPAQNGENIPRACTCVKPLQTFAVIRH